MKHRTVAVVIAGMAGDRRLRTPDRPQLGDDRCVVPGVLVAGRPPARVVAVQLLQLARLIRHRHAVCHSAPRHPGARKQLLLVGCGQLPRGNGPSHEGEAIDGTEQSTSQRLQSCETGVLWAYCDDRRT